MSYQGTTAEWTKKADNDQCVRIRLDKTRCCKCYRSAAIRTKVFWTNFALIFLGLEYKLSKFITSLYPLQLAGTWSMLSSWFERRTTVSLLLLFESLVGSSRSVIGGGWIVSLWSSLVTLGWMVVPNFSPCLLRWRCKIFLNVQMATFPGGGLVISCPWLLPINTFCNGRGMRCRLGPFILIGDCRLYVIDMEMRTKQLSRWSLLFWVSKWLLTNPVKWNIEWLPNVNLLQPLWPRKPSSLFEEWKSE